MNVKTKFFSFNFISGRSRKTDIHIIPENFLQYSEAGSIKLQCNVRATF